MNKLRRKLVKEVCESLINEPEEWVFIGTTAKRKDGSFALFCDDASWINHPYEVHLSILQQYKVKKAVRYAKCKRILEEV